MTHNDPDLLAAARALSTFAGAQLTKRIASLEAGFSGKDSSHLTLLLDEAKVSHNLLASAYLLKRVAGQINVVIHAIGILLCLPHILDPGEKVQYLSLGAGNAGKAFDLETNLRIAEFKFIHWQGGTETIRQNSLFKDLYLLIEHPTDKQKFMYVLGTQHPLKFLKGRRALSSVMSRNSKLWKQFQAKYGSTIATVSEYHALKGAEVELVDISAHVPALGVVAEPEESIA